MTWIIYTVCASQEAQPLQKTIWITYHFVQIHKLDEAASPTTSWCDCWSIIGRYIHVFRVRLQLGKIRRQPKFEWACVLYCSRIPSFFRSMPAHFKRAPAIFSHLSPFTHTRTSRLECLQRHSDDPWYTAVKRFVLQAHKAVESHRSSSHHSSDPSLVKSSIVLGAQIN